MSEENTAVLNEEEQGSEQEFEEAFAEFAGGEDEHNPLDNKADNTPDDRDNSSDTDSGDNNRNDVEPSELQAFREKNPQFADLSDDLLLNVKTIADDAETLAQQARSAHGRLQPAQKKINELKREINFYRSSQQAKSVEASDGKEWNEFKKNYPDIAEAVEVKMASTEPRSGSDKLQAQIDKLEEAERKRVISAEYAALHETHNDFVDVVQSPKFQVWLFNQPEPVQEMIKSTRAADAAWLISNYKTYAKIPMGGKASETSDQVNDILLRRKRQLKQGQGVTSKPVGHAPTDKGGDFVSEFNFFAKQKEEERKRNSNNNYF